MKALNDTELTDERKAYLTKSVEKLDGHYAAFRETNASRSGDQIALIVQAILNDLNACPTARHLDQAFREGLHALHEDLGIPKLALKPVPKPAIRRSK